MKLPLNFVTRQATGSKPQPNKVQIETNCNDVMQIEADWDAKHKMNKENDMAAMLWGTNHIKYNIFGIIRYKLLWVRKTSMRVYDERTHGHLYGSSSKMRFCYWNVAG